MSSDRSNFPSKGCELNTHIASDPLRIASSEARRPLCGQSAKGLGTPTYSQTLVQVPSSACIVVVSISSHLLSIFIMTAKDALESGRDPLPDTH